MVYGVILAAGVGKRMGLDIPKQYVKIEDKPIIIYTLQALLSNDYIDKVYIAISNEWKEDVKSMINMFIDKEELSRIFIVEGGKERIDTIMNVKNIIEKNNLISDDDIIMFHDAVRPFITNEVINDSIEGARVHKAVVAGIKAVDTILYSEDGDEVKEILDRSKIFHGQAPDTFNLNYFIELSNMLTDEQKQNITGTSQFCSFNKKPIFISKGSEMNFKITTIEDLEKAKMIVKGRVRK